MRDARMVEPIRLVAPPAGETAALPRNVEAEAALLGAMMFDNRAVDRLADIVQARDFAEPLHGRIFAAIIREVADGRAANPITLRPMFEADDAMRELGGPGYLAALTGSGAVSIGATGFARQIRDLAQRRRLIEAGIAALDSAADPSIPLAEAAAAIEAAITEADRGDATWIETSASDSLRDFLEVEPERRGVLTGLAPIDDLVGHMAAGAMIVLGGRPGSGKTASAVSLALGAARRGHATLYISLEMAATELAGRMAADLCFDGAAGVPYAKIRDRELGPDQRRAVARAHGALSELPLTIIDAALLNIAQLRRSVRRHAARLAAKGSKLELVIVDYLQLLAPSEKGRSSYENVSAISRAIKVLAKESGVAILALAQLSRDVEKRPDQRPLLSDLRDSGQIEQDADAVVFVSRPDAALQAKRPASGTAEFSDWERACAELAGMIEFVCAKRRNGRTGSRRGQFFGAYQAVRGAR